MHERPTVIWQIHDEKPGHRNQLRGLTNALGELLSIEAHSIRAPRRRSCLTALFSKHFAPGQSLPAPTLILGAGHSTHLAVLAARRSFGGKAIILMKPSLPAKLFDLCLVPEHDGVSDSEKVVNTRGVINAVRPSKAHQRQTGLLLIGGPSSAHGWSDEAMIAQVASIVRADLSIRWQLTTSRRTPASFLAALEDRQLPNLQVTPHQQTTAEWLPAQLASASQVWVSEDSVSMVYEALTSGAAVGVLKVPCKKQGRVAVGMETLIRSNCATRFEDWQPGTRLAAPPLQLDEARRCANLICERLLHTPANKQAS